MWIYLCNESSITNPGKNLIGLAKFLIFLWFDICSQYNYSLHSFILKIIAVRLWKNISSYSLYFLLQYMFFSTYKLPNNIHVDLIDSVNGTLNFHFILLTSNSSLQLQLNCADVEILVDERLQHL